ncbi:MAG: hypothetical protein ED859_01195 [Desulfuromonadales bacterium]|nr:MAG: hypothetical protein ED859_01195 [Desulfuromonadales bacterium]
MTFELWRQYDNGNRFLLGTFTSRDFLGGFFWGRCLLFGDFFGDAACYFVIDGIKKIASSVPLEFPAASLLSFLAASLLSFLVPITIHSKIVQHIPCYNYYNFEHLII